MSQETEVINLIKMRAHSATDGYRYFKKRSRAEKNCRFVLFKDPELLDAALYHFDAFAESAVLGGKFILWFCAEEDLKKAQMQIKTPVKMEVLPDIVCEQILNAFAFCDLSKWLTVVSLKKPYRTFGERMIGKSRVSVEDVVCFDIYGLNETPQAQSKEEEGC